MESSPYDSSRRKDKSRSRDYSRTKYDEHTEEARYIDRYYDYDDDERANDYDSRRNRSRSRSRSRDRDRRHKSSSSTASSSKRYSQQEGSKKFDDFDSPSNSSRFNPSSWNANSTPSNTIMMRQIPIYMSEQELKSDLSALGVPFKDCRLVKSRETGTSRGFAFIDFASLEEAQNWMNTTQGFITVGGNSRVTLFYSQPKYDEANGKRGLPGSDWDCTKCGIKNFKRRDRCFKCNLAREDSEKMREGEGYENVGLTACNTLLLRGLDALTTEDAIDKVVNSMTGGSVATKNVYVVREKLTNVSSGFAFVEMHSIGDASVLMERMAQAQPCFEIDGKQVTFNYCKNNYSTAITQLESTSKVSYPQVESRYYHQASSASASKVNQADQANSAAAVAQAAMKNMQKKQEMLTLMTNAENYVTYATPDVTTYVYDESSGYYYDASTGFYYDASSQYYYNPLTLQYMYWDAVKFTYVAVTGTSDQVASSTATSTTPAIATAAVQSEKEPETGKRALETDDEMKEPKMAKTSEVKKSKTPTATQIAKNMEKWAESQNKKKEAIKKSQTVTISTPTTTSTLATASSSEATATATASTFASTPKAFPSEPISMKIASSASAPVALEHASPSLLMQSAFSISKPASKCDTQIQSVCTEQPAQQKSPKASLDDSKFVDRDKMACLLCKRKFDSADQLNKHLQMSDLHKKNLENYKKESAIGEEKDDKRESEALDSVAAAIQYRDRAKERRDKYGMYEAPPKSDTREKLPIDTDYYVPPPIPEEQVSTSSTASKLMKKMGWNEGAGLGRNNQGITAPIEANVRTKGLGLGAAAASFDPNDTYKDAVRKSARARFEQLN